MEENYILSPFEICIGMGRITVQDVTVGISIFFWNTLTGVGSGIYLPYIKNDTREKIKMIVEKLGKKEVYCKFAGGADIYPLEIGKKNLVETVKILEELGIPIAGYDAGGSLTRKYIEFWTKTGHLFVKYNIQLAKSL